MKDAMKYVAVLVALLAVALGLMAIVYGEADDSPGGQLIGVAFVVAGIVLGVRAVRSATR